MLPCNLHHSLNGCRDTQYNTRRTKTRRYFSGEQVVGSHGPGHRPQEYCSDIFGGMCSMLVCVIFVVDLIAILHLWFWQNDFIILLLVCVIAIAFGAGEVPGEENAPVPEHIVTWQNDICFRLLLLCEIAVAFAPVKSSFPEHVKIEQDALYNKSSLRLYNCCSKKGVQNRWKCLGKGQHLDRTWATTMVPSSAYSGAMCCHPTTI